MRRLLPVLLAATLVAPLAVAGDNPPAPGFDADGSDARAIEIADAVMDAMGGREAWDATRYLSWNFFGFRHHVWDKHRGLDRIEWNDRETGEPIVVVVDIHDGSGRAWVADQPVTDPERLATLTGGAREAWINDAYWLVMPYKLKDSGVTLTYAGEAPMADGRDADVLQLTFEGVGVTPQNKYRVYVARDTGLVEQWDFFGEATDPEPRFSTPWHGWTEHGAILLCGDRGQRQITDIAVHETLPDSVFTDPSPTGLRSAGR